MPAVLQDRNSSNSSTQPCSLLEEPQLVAVKLALLHLSLGAAGAGLQPLWHALQAAQQAPAGSRGGGGGGCDACGLSGVAASLLLAPGSCSSWGWDIVADECCMSLAAAAALGEQQRLRPAAGGNAQSTRSAAGSCEQQRRGAKVRTAAAMPQLDAPDGSSGDGSSGQSAGLHCLVRAWLQPPEPQHASRGSRGSSLRPPASSVMSEKAPATAQQCQVVRVGADGTAELRQSLVLVCSRAQLASQQLVLQLQLQHGAAGPAAMLLQWSLPLVELLGSTPMPHGYTDWKLYMAHQRPGCKVPLRGLPGAWLHASAHAAPTDLRGQPVVISSPRPQACCLQPVAEPGQAGISNSSNDSGKLVGSSAQVQVHAVACNARSAPSWRAAAEHKARQAAALAASMLWCCWHAVSQLVGALRAWSMTAMPSHGQRQQHGGLALVRISILSVEWGSPAPSTGSNTAAASASATAGMQQGAWHPAALPAGSALVMRVGPYWARLDLAASQPPGAAADSSARAGTPPPGSCRASPRSASPACCSGGSASSSTSSTSSKSSSVAVSAAPFSAAGPVTRPLAELLVPVFAPSLLLKAVVFSSASGGLLGSSKQPQLQGRLLYRSYGLLPMLRAPRVVTLHLRGEKKTPAGERQVVGRMHIRLAAAFPHQLQQQQQGGIGAFLGTALHTFWCYLRLWLAYMSSPWPLGLLQLGLVQAAAVRDNVEALANQQLVAWLQACSPPVPPLVSERLTRSTRGRFSPARLTHHIQRLKAVVQQLPPLDMEALRAWRQPRTNLALLSSAWLLCFRLRVTLLLGAMGVVGLTVVKLVRQVMTGLQGEELDDSDGDAEQQQQQQQPCGVSSLDGSDRGCSSAAAAGQSPRSTLLRQAPGQQRQQSQQSPPLKSLAARAAAAAGPPPGPDAAAQTEGARPQQYQRSGPLTLLRNLLTSIASGALASAGLELQNRLDDVATTAEKLAAALSGVDAVASSLVYAALMAAAVGVYVAGPGGVVFAGACWVLRPPQLRAVTGSSAHHALFANLASHHSSSESNAM